MHSPNNGHTKSIWVVLQGTLNWMHVPADTLMKNITVPGEKIYQFAISANTKTERSGMVWADCTIIHNKSKNIFDKFLKVVNCYRLYDLVS